MHSTSDTELLTMSRQSLWLVRNQRRHAAIQAGQEELKQHLCSIQAALNRIENQLIIHLPGLQDTFQEDTNTKVEMLLEKIDSLASHVHASCAPKREVDQTCALERRVRSMEILLVRTSLDDSSKIDERMGQPARNTVKNREPESEISPEKVVMSDERIDALMPDCVEPSCLHFDITDMDDITSIAIQTDLVLSEEQSCQTSPHNKQRRGRCNGRADQANDAISDEKGIQAVVCTTERATDTEVDEQHALESVMEYTKVADGKTTTVKPCILNEAFVNALMSGMDARMDEKFERMCSRYNRK